MHLKIDCLSDTHSQHQKIHLPGGDIAVHCGDCSTGSLESALEFLDWFKEQNYTHRILVAGNHDSIFELIPELMEEECKKRGITLLNDSGCTIEGIKIWGSPVQPWFCDWAFNRQRGADIRRHWNLIPPDTEILITHGPPYKIFDRVPKRDGSSEHVGCEDLYRKVLQTQVKLHVFGHIHEDKGHAFLDGRLYLNASSLDGAYHFIKPGYVRLSNQGGRYVVPSSSADMNPS
jgi:Icc-related predicted phosphoesterase